MDYYSMISQRWLVNGDEFTFFVIDFLSYPRFIAHVYTLAATCGQTQVCLNLKCWEQAMPQQMKTHRRCITLQEVVQTQHDNRTEHTEA